MIIRLLLQLLLQLNILFKIGRGGFGGRVRNGNSDEATGRAGSSQQEISSPRPFPSVVDCVAVVGGGGREGGKVYLQFTGVYKHAHAHVHVLPRYTEQGGGGGITRQKMNKV